MTRKYNKKKHSELQEPLTIDDLIYVVGNETDSKIKRTFLKTIKYKGDLRKAMREEGYSETMINNPQKVKRTRTWEEQVDKYFPMDALMAIEKKLWAQKDWRAWANSADRIHKMRGSFTKKVEHNIHKVTEYRNMSDKDLKNIIDADYEEVNDRAIEGPKGDSPSGDVEKTS